MAELGKSKAAASATRDEVHPRRPSQSADTSPSPLHEGRGQVRGERRFILHTLSKLERTPSPLSSPP